jgi:hypothetical protein
MLSHKLITTETGIGQIKAPGQNPSKHKTQDKSSPDKKTRYEIIMQSYYILLY